MFDETNRRKRIGTKVIKVIFKKSKKRAARMEALIFDRYAYSNLGLEEHNMRVEMRKMF